jgi:hypothetical protein
MAWVDVADNQTISNENLKNAIDTGAFSAGGTAIPLTSPENKRQVTKGRVSTYVNIPNTNFPAYSEKTSEQLITKADIFQVGDFVLDPQYGKVFTAMSGSGLPTFTFNVTSLTTLQYNSKISAQNIVVTVSGTAFTTPVRVSLYVDSVLIESKALSNTGSDVITLTLPIDVFAPSQIRISINSGTVPAPSVTFSDVPIKSTAVSRTTGQYQIAAGSINEENTLGQKGYLYVSSDYGATWVQKSIYAYWYKVAISDDGVYCLAVANGEAWKSVNSGNTWTQITNFPSPAGSSTQSQNFTGAALSSNGQYQTIVTRSSQFPDGSYYAIIYTSSDYGSSWTARNANGTYTNTNYTCVTMTSNGQYQWVGYKQGSFYYIYESQNFGVGWAGAPQGLEFSTTIIQDISFGQSFGGGRGLAAEYANYNISGSGTPDKNILIFNIKFGSWDPATGGSPNSAWYGVASISSAFTNDSTRIGYAISKESGAATSYIRKVNDDLTNPAVVTTITSSGLYKYRSIACSGDGMYILAGFRNGLRRSTDGGVTWGNL